jgi:hypothetical protein
LLKTLFFLNPNVIQFDIKTWFSNKYVYYLFYVDIPNKLLICFSPKIWWKCWKHDDDNNYNFVLKLFLRLWYPAMGSLQQKFLGQLWIKTRLLVTSGYMEDRKNKLKINLARHANNARHWFLYNIIYGKTENVKYCETYHFLCWFIPTIATN